jgi:hypothetical protein
MIKYILMKQHAPAPKTKTPSAHHLQREESHTNLQSHNSNPLQQMADSSPHVIKSRVYQLMANAGLQLKNKEKNVVQRVPVLTTNGPALDTDEEDGIWAYFNTIEEQEDLDDLTAALKKAGANDLAGEIETEWEIYLESLSDEAGDDEEDVHDDENNDDDADDNYDDEGSYDDIDAMADDYMEHASVSKLHTGKRKKKKAPAEKRIAVHKAQVKKEHHKVATSKHLEVQSTTMPDLDGGKEDATVFPNVRGEAREIAPVEPVDLKGLTKKEINGYEILSSELKGSRIETSFSLLSNGRTVSKPMMVHMSVQRHHFAHMESGEAKELNSLIKPSVSIPSLCNEMKEIAKQVALFWGSSPVTIPKVMEVTSSSGRHFEIDGLTIGAAHAYVTGGTDVVPVSRDEFVCLKAIKDAAQSGDYVSARGILQRHIPSQSARKKLFKLAVSSFQINESVITELEAEGLSVKKSGGKQKGGDYSVHHRGPVSKR